MPQNNNSNKNKNMKIKNYKLWFLAIMLNMPFLSNAVTVTDTALAANVQVCLKPELVRLAFSVGGSGTTGSYLDIKLPVGFTWEGLAYGPIVTGGSGSNSITYAGIVAGKHRLTFGSSTALQSIMLGFYQKASCGAGTSSFTTRDSLFFYEGIGSINISATNAFNGSAPDLSITGLSYSPVPAIVGGTVTRTLTITNGGIGGTQKFKFIDKYGLNNFTINPSSFYINPSGSNYNIPSSNIFISNDSFYVSFDSSLSQQIGDNDQIFENSESFVLRYQFTLISCGNSSNLVSSTISSVWGCDNSTPCVKNNLTTAVSVQVPSSPNLTFFGRRDENQCFNGATASIDTVRIINSGGMARNLNLILGNSRGNIFQNSTNRIDTSSIFYKIGKNGSLIKNKVLTGLSFTDCKGVTGFSRINMDTIDFLATNDTLLIFIPRFTNVCDFGCRNDGTTLYSILSAAIGLQGSYSNACANVNFVIPKREFTSNFDYGANITNTSESSLSCGQKLTLKYTGTGSWWFVNTLKNRVSNEFEINLPAPFLLDTISGVTAYIRLGGVNYYPTARPSANVFRFNNPVVNMASAVLFIHIKGESNSTVCSGPQLISLNSKINPDTAASCNSHFPNWCVNTSIDWFSCITCCPEGIVLSELKSYRKNIDINEPNNNGVAGVGKADSTLIKRTAYLIGDTMLLFSKAIVKTSASNPLYENGYFKTGLRGGSTNWTHLQTTVSHWGPSTTLNVVNISPTFIGDSVIWDLSSLSDLLDSDTISISTSFRVNYIDFTAGNLNNLNPTRWYASRVSNPSISQQYGCGIAYTNTALIGYLLSTGGATSTSVIGCSQVVVSGGIRYTTESQPWPYELRPSAYPTRIAYRIPTGWVIDSVNLPSQRSSGFINNGINTLAYSIVGDSLIFNVAYLFTPNGGTMRPFADREEFNYRIYLKPSCKSSSSVFSSGSTYDYINVRSSTGNRKFSVSRSNLQATLPQFISSSSNPVKQAFTKIIDWPLTVTNITNINAPNSYIYLQSLNNLITIDSVYSGLNKLTAVNGFYQLGTIVGNGNRNLTIYAKNNACSLDSLLVYVGYDCTTYPSVFTNNNCYPPNKLYVQPQLSSIQTSITSLSSTPTDPSNSSSSAYGSNLINMCQSFPFEMTIQSSQAGNIYDVKETLILPFNGGVGLDYISDSGYIEYPIGTTPRAFSTAANTAILTQISSGNMTLDLAQIDPSNFGTASEGLPGTGLGNNNTRRAILRWKMKSNCDLVSGDQWTARQEAKSPCGGQAAGNNTITSGFALSLAGVTNPYVATVKVSTGLDGCGDQFTQVRLEKTGGAPPAPTDSITIRLPKLVAAGSMVCYGTACPGGTGSTQSYSTRTDALYQYLSFAYPNTAGANGDTLLYQFPMRTINKSVCANNQTVKADVFQQLTIYCGSPIPANLCPNAKSSLGSETKSFDIRKAILSFTGYSNTYVYPSIYKYKFSGNVANTSSAVAAPTGITLKTFMDVNNNLTYEKGIDALVKTTVLGSSIGTNGSLAFSDSFVNSSYQPSPNLPMYTVIDTGDATANCFCGGVVQSAFNQALPIEFLSIKAINLNNQTGKVIWHTNTDLATSKFNIYRKAENETVFTFIGSVPNRGGANGINEFVYYNPISSLPTGKIYYQIEAVEQGGITKRSSIVNITKTNAIQNAGLFSIVPNPANAQVGIQLAEGLLDGIVKIMDINGKVLFTQSFEGLNTTLNISQLAAGIYSVQVTSNDGIETQKLSVIR